MKHAILVIALVLTGWAGLYGQETVTGAQVLTTEPYEYGRFEVRMQSAPGDGIVSSFFLYNWDIGCNWPLENNEIDIEMTGNVEDLYFTTHYPGPWHYSDQMEVDFNPHAEMHEYAIEWVPGTVRWFVDGELFNVQDESFVANLIHPMRLFMNLWVANATTWVGEWDPAVLPQSSHYDWVKVYTYTPGTGDYGTDNAFTFNWEDHFDGTELDPARWEITDFGDFDGNLAGFYQQNVSVEDGVLSLHLTEPGDWIITVPTTFSVDMNDYPLEPGDVIYVNGGFNNWCGTCAPMSDGDGDGIWTLTIPLQPGNHEYLFTKNFWEENGGAPLGSACDYQPCDEFGNYGFQVHIDDASITLPTYCWGTCSACTGIGVEEERGSAALQLQGGKVNCSGQPGDVLEVFSASGRRLFEYTLESTHETVVLPASIQGWIALQLRGNQAQARTHGVVIR